MHEHAVITLVFLHSDNYIYPFFSKHVHVKEKKHKVWRFTGAKAKVASVEDKISLPQFSEQAAC